MREDGEEEEEEEKRAEVSSVSGVTVNASKGRVGKGE